MRGRFRACLVGALAGDLLDLVRQPEDARRAEGLRFSEEAVTIAEAHGWGTHRIGAETLAPSLAHEQALPVELRGWVPGGR